MSTGWKNRKTWKDGKVPYQFIIEWYDLWLRCDSWIKVKASLELSALRIHHHEEYPELVYAKKLADERRGTRNTFSGYIYKHMSKEAQKVWEDCQFFKGAENATVEVEKILNGQTTKLRQELFLHALVHSNFDVSEAMSIVAISTQTYSRWAQDLEFRQLIEEIQWHKKNFFERALVDLVENRHPGAVLFVNRTINADRGYGEKMQIQHQSGDGIRLDELDLDLDTKRKILEAVRRKKLETGLPKQKALDVKSQVVDAEDISQTEK